MAAAWMTYRTEPITVFRMEWFVTFDPDMAGWYYHFLDGVWRERLNLWSRIRILKRARMVCDVGRVRYLRVTR